MSVNKDDVRKIAHLARMELQEGELEKYTAELNQILGHVDQLNRLDTTSVPPMFGVTPEVTMRVDAVVEPAPEFLAAVFTQAPQSDHAEGDFFVVPPIIE